MLALLISPIAHTTVIVSMKSREYAELSVAGYSPIRQGTRRELEEIEDDIDCLPDLELNSAYNELWDRK